ncbi:MAG: M2 family metallopeptidase [Deltaproteobacteria bacterium]|nr:M2 family metallopeptidase [Deltaproteobacteria bacterium]
MKPENFIDKMAEIVAPLEQKLCSLYWELATTGKPEVAKELAETEKEVKILFSNRQALADLKKWKVEGIADPLIARQVDLLINDYIPNQLDEKTISDLVERQTEIENIFNNFRSELDGKKLTDNDIKEILKTEKSNERRQKTWEASKQIGPLVADKIKELAKRRNAAAQKLGFKNHFEMALELQELDSRWLLKLFTDLKAKTDRPFKARVDDLHKKLGKVYGVPTNEVMPWHYENVFAQAPPSSVTVDLDPFFQTKDVLEICRRFYTGIGLPIDDVLNRSDLFEKEGKSQHAFCICMDKKTDVRVLANVRKNSYWMSTMLHELGHAAYSKNIDHSLPYFLRDEAHIFATEAIAMLMERVLHDPQWLAKNCGVPASKIKGMENDLRDSLSLDKLTIARWVMLVTNFEKELYGNPDQDLDGLWWKLVAQYQFISKPASRNAPDWACKIHIASSPVYYQNYLLGELMAAQIASVIASPKGAAISFVGNKKIGKQLDERLFKMGMKLSWKELVPHVTGQELGAASFVSQFC